MAYSMTGIGEGRYAANGYDVNITIRSVNHRYLNVQIRAPRGYQRFEPVLREQAMTQLSRGKVDVYLEFYELPAETSRLVLNRGLFENYLQFIQDLSSKNEIPDGVTTERLLRENDILSIVPSRDVDSKLEEILVETMVRAIKSLKGSRAEEGERLTEAMAGYVTLIEESISRIEPLADQQPEIARQRLQESISRLASDVSVDESRLEQEVVLSAVRSDITEELTRLRSHMIGMKEILGRQKAIGKELEFLIQEIHREVNTIGSKSVVLEINKLVVAMKLNVEKLREQVQNLE